MTLKEYVDNHWTDCRYYRVHSITRYNCRLQQLLDSVDLDRIINPILNVERLSRKDVFQWVKKDIYQGFIAAMLWGGISLATGKKKKVSNVKLAFSFPMDQVKQILHEVKGLLSKGKEKEAFDYLLTGDGKIPGIGVSYLTKILYFYSPCEQNGSLIYDKWGRFTHATLIIDDEKDNLKDYYSMIHNKDFKSYLKPIKKEEDLYLDYLSRMRNFLSILNHDYKMINNTGHLEAFLFGDILSKKNQQNNNPRYFIYKKVERYFVNNEGC